MIGRNDFCWCGSQKKWKKCHWPSLPFSQNDKLHAHYLETWQILLKTPEQIQKIKKACQVASLILAELMQAAKIGVTTRELDELSRKLHQKMDALPAALHYGTPPFPASICTSLNEVVCHGIPDDRPLQEGDIVNIDVASIKDGFFGDCSAMVCFPPLEEAKKRVILAAWEGTVKAIEPLKPGLLLSTIAPPIEEAAKKHSCSVVEQFVGHGVGLHFHEKPDVLFYYNNSNIPLAPGMVFTVEPMINAGSFKAEIDPTNEWEARTVDGKPSAQFEHTVCITSAGHEVLTQWSFDPRLLF